MLPLTVSPDGAGNSARTGEKSVCDTEPSAEVSELKAESWSLTAGRVGGLGCNKT